MSMEPPNILSATKPLLYETGVDDWPYAFAGTCFPLRYGNRLYILSAKHCFTNHSVRPEDMLYPTPLDQRTFFAFDTKIEGCVPTATSDLHSDFLAMRVASSKHNDDELRLQTAMDVSDGGNVIKPTSQALMDVWLRGYPFDCPAHEIDYDGESIRSQAYTTNGGGVDVKDSQYDHCYWLRLKTPIGSDMSPCGMSGSPVYGIRRKDAGSVFLGLLTCFEPESKRYLFIGAEVIVGLLRKA